MKKNDTTETALSNGGETRETRCMTNQVLKKDKTLLPVLTYELVDLGCVGFKPNSRHWRVEPEEPPLTEPSTHDEVGILHSWEGPFFPRDLMGHVYGPECPRQVQEALGVVHQYVFRTISTVAANGNLKGAKVDIFPYVLDHYAFHKKRKR